MKMCCRNEVCLLLGYLTTLRIISSTNFNAHFNIKMYVTLLSSTCFGPWHAHPQEEQLHKHSIWYPRSSKRLYTTLSTGIVYSRLEERGYQMLCLCSCSSWGWACQGPKHVEDSNVTYMPLLNCALKLVEEIILTHTNVYTRCSIWLKSTTGHEFTSIFLLPWGNTVKQLLHNFWKTSINSPPPSSSNAQRLLLYNLIFTILQRQMTGQNKFSDYPQ